MWSVSLRERLSGAMVLASDAARERPIHVELQVSIDLASRPPAAELTGELDAPGLARAAKLVGCARATTRAVRYDAAFVADDGRELALTLERRLALANLYTSLTVLPGEVRDARGELVARCLLRYDARQELGRSLASLRATRA